MRIKYQSALPAEIQEHFRGLFLDRSQIYVLGLTRHARTLATLFPVQGFIDDYASDSEFLGRPILRGEEVSRDALIISGVVDGRPLSALRRLRSAGFSKVIDYFSLYRLAPDLVPPPPFSTQNTRDILQNRAKYEWLEKRLADEESRATLEKLINFRLNWDLADMEGFSLRLDQQYFEPFMELASTSVFVDGGGFDGQTSRTYAQRAPSHRRIYCFEPESGAMQVAKAKLADLRTLTYVQKGLFSRNGTARFNSNASSASGLSAEGDTEIEIVKLDDEVEESVDYIKLDLEGAECDALDGAQEHIAQDHPKLAVCVYHDQRDFWRVPERILAIDEGYEIYLRHYTEGPLETVMYFR